MSTNSEDYIEMPYPSRILKPLLKLTPTIAANLFVFGLVGCSHPLQLQDYKIVSDGPAPKTVTLTHMPAKDSAETLDYQDQVENLETHTIDLRTAKVNGSITATSPAWYVLSIHFSDFAIPRNDQKVAEDQEKAKFESLTPTLERNKNGNVLDGMFYEPPISYNFPNKPLQIGDTWKGWLGGGPKKQVVDFALNDIVHAKGHDLAEIVYGYAGNGDDVEVHEWIDANTGWSMKEDDVSRRKLRGREMMDRTLMIDPIFEH